jgi:hypothetical protein
MKPWLFLGVSEVLVAVSAQTNILPENLISIFVQLPLVAVIIWLQLQNQKWLEHMLEVQRSSLKSIYEGQNAFLDTLLKQIDDKQNKMVDQIEYLGKMVALLHATVSEVVKVDDVIDRLLGEIRRRDE